MLFSNAIDWLRCFFEEWELWLLLGVLVVTGYQLYYYFRYLWLRKDNCNLPTDSKLPKVTVVVCAHNEAENLQNYLQILLSQDYPEYEVIVVDDESEDSTLILLEQYAREYPNFYHTFVPKGARVISSKKLALTIGIKAAHYDHILLTDADCRPESRNWIREMMKGYDADSTEMVLGFSPYFEKDTLLSGLISYDTLFNGLQYMGMAQAGHPYMGVGRNLSYRRSTFFNNQGFQGLLDVRAGDDDLFVSKVITNYRKRNHRKSNVHVVCNPDALTWSAPKTTWKQWMQQKQRHLSVSNKYTLTNKIRLTFEPFTRGMIYALLLVTLLYGSHMLVAAVIALWLIRLLIMLLVMNRAARKLQLSRMGLEIILYDIFLPVITLYDMAVNSFRKQKIYW